VDIGGILVLLLQIYFYAVLAWVILSWIPTSSTHPLGRVNVFLDRIIYPVILPLRRVIPPLRVGGGMLDLSPIVLLIGISLLIRLVNQIL
jgi:YggT family protein